MKRIVLAYSGGFEGTAALRLLLRDYCPEVVTLTLDLGQGGDLMAVRDRALATGATRAHVIDVREQLAREYLLPFVQVGLPAQDTCPIARFLGWPMIVRKLVEMAHLEEATVVSFAGVGDRSVYMRLDGACHKLSPDLWVMCPTRDVPRDVWMPYAGAGSNPDPPSQGQVKAGASVWGRWVEYVPDANSPEPPESVYALTLSPDECPEEPASLEIEFDHGVPVRANGIEMPLLELLESVETIAGAHGVGRMPPVWLPLDGDARRWYAQEAPAPVVLRTAHEYLERRMVPPRVLEKNRKLAGLYEDEIRIGRPVPRLDPFTGEPIPSVKSRVCGAVMLKLSRGDCRIVRR